VGVGSRLENDVRSFPRLIIDEAPLMPGAGVILSDQDVITYWGTGSLCQSSDECAGVSLKLTDSALTSASVIGT
jgi:hypothetical protein